MYTVFGSGTCRLLHTLDIGKHKLNSIHTYCGREFKGVHFLGKQKNSRNHIQFLRYIKGQINLPDDIKNDFFSVYHKEYDIDKRPSNPDENLKNIKEQFDNCDIYLFEIASIKVQSRNGFYISDENTTDFTQTILTKEELYCDLEEIIGIIGPTKKIIFLNHLRLQQFEGGPVIENREIVYETIYNITQKYDNVFQYDPTLMVKNKNDYKLYFGDPWHYKPEGMILNFENIYNLICKIMNGQYLNNNTSIIGNITNNTLYDSDDETRDFHINNLHS
jgi:hypothetical protein